MTDVGVYSYFGYSLPFDERLETIRQAGFRITSIGLGEEEELVRAGREDEMPGRARSKGLFVEYAHAPDDLCNKLWSDCGEERRETRRKYVSYVNFCEKHSIPTLVVHVSRSKGDQPAPPGVEGLQVLEYLVKHGEGSNVRIAVENTQKPEYLDYLFSRISSPCFGLCYDTSHDFLYSPQPGLLLERWGHLLLATHISDNDGLADRHWLPKEGVVDWNKVKACFPLKTYAGSLNLEIFPKAPESESPLGFLKRAHERITWVEDMLRAGR